METFPPLVPRLSAETLQVFLGSSGVAKVLLLTSKPETPAMFNALAANFRQRHFAFGDVHNSDTEAVKFLGADLKASPPRLALCTCLEGICGKAASVWQPAATKACRCMRADAAVGMLACCVGCLQPLYDCCGSWTAPIRPPNTDKTKRCEQPPLLLWAVPAFCWLPNVAAA